MLTAKNKAPTKAQRIRNNATKAIAKANKAALDISIEAAIVKAVHGTQQGEAACRVLAFALEREFGKDWYVWDSGNMRTDNEKAVFARLEDYRKNCQELALNKGLSNINKPWSDAKRVQKEKNLGGRPNERLKKPMDARFKEGLTKLYRAWMKEEKFTDEEFAIGNKIGELLTFLKVDISKLG
jgi:hypothetical protein